jgi:hypothetical protein
VLRERGGGGDERLAAGRTHERDRGLDLGAHRALGELGEERFGVVGVKYVDRRLAGAAEVAVDGVRRGQDHEPLGAERGGEEGGGAVLVDHGVDAAELAVSRDDRNSAAAAGDRERPGIEEGADRVELDDLARVRRRNDAAVAAARVGDDLPAAVALELLRLRLRIERPDRLRRLLEGGVVRVHAHVRDDAGDRPVDKAAQLGRDQRADLRLRLGDG